MASGVSDHYKVKPFSIRTIISSNLILEVVLCYIVICTGYVYVPVEVRKFDFIGRGGWILIFYMFGKNYWTVLDENFKAIAPLTAEIEPQKYLRLDSSRLLQQNFHISEL